MKKDQMLNVISKVHVLKPNGFTVGDCVDYQNTEHGAIDYHVYSNFLYNLNSHGFIKDVGHNRDGMTIYNY